MGKFHILGIKTTLGQHVAKKSSCLIYTGWSLHIVHKYGYSGEHLIVVKNDVRLMLKARTGGRRPETFRCPWFQSWIKSTAWDSPGLPVGLRQQVVASMVLTVGHSACCILLLFDQPFFMRKARPCEQHTLQSCNAWYSHGQAFLLLS